MCSTRNFLFSIAALVACLTLALAATTGSVSGSITDQTGSVIPAAKVTITNTAQGIHYKTVADPKGA